MSSHKTHHPVQLQQLFMLLALSEAEKTIGATAPNPPVGACLVKGDKILECKAHPKAGDLHAEALTIELALKHYGADVVRGSTLYITLEPCNHTGKTPPCTETIINAGISKVVFGAHDPNPDVKGGGEDFLKSKGIEVEHGLLKKECEHLLAPFKKWKLKKLPWVVQKLAFRVTNFGEFSMIPDKFHNTFTSQQSLWQAHLERRKSDAILTGIGTVLTDFPKFNVRHMPDHNNRRRLLFVLSKDGALPTQEWLDQEDRLGFEVMTFTDVHEALSLAAQMDVHRLLVEAGPTLSSYFTENNLWDERLVFVQNFSENSTLGKSAPTPLDFAYREFREEP